MKGKSKVVRPWEFCHQNLAAQKIGPHYIVEVLHNWIWHRIDVRSIESFGAEAPINKRCKVHLLYLIDTSLVEALKEFPKFLNKGLFYGFLMEKIAKTSALDVLIKDSRRRVFELWLENGIEPKLEEPNGTTEIKIFTRFNLLDNEIVSS